MDDNPEIRDRLNVNKSTYHNKRPRERFICFIRGAKWMKINHLNGPSPIHDTSTWLSQSIQCIRHVCCRLGMQKHLPWKCFRTAFGHYDFPSTSTSQQAWRMRKRYHLLLRFGGVKQKKLSWGSAMNNAFLLSYSSKRWSKVWILVYRKKIYYRDHVISNTWATRLSLSFAAERADWPDLGKK